MKLEQLKTEIRDLLTPILAEGDVYCVDLQLRREHRTLLVQVFLDTDAGITIDQCAAVSRNLAQSIDQAGMIEGSYRLEVSSPGLDRPLRLLRQYVKNKGRRYKVKIKRDNETIVFDGEISSVEGTVITFSKDDGSTDAIEFEDVIEAREQLPW